ncbi:MAG: ATP-binding cassette domain-containing protein [Kocuria sp.]|nr:ATP-binding cassette domain-containing protein [Kocuria sp.]
MYAAGTQGEGHRIEVQDLTRRFGQITAVDHVSFAVEPGRMTGFVGANGAGKTTTMRMIMGVLRVSSGQVLWDGSPITREHRAACGYMPEERGLYPKQSIVDQLGYLGQLRGMSRAGALVEANRLVERFHLADRAKDKLETLSLGNQQRVQVAAALIHRPAALILDEPFSGLDPTAVDSMVDLLREHLDRGVPVLFSSHQLDLVDRLCDSMVIMHQGKVLASGTADELRASRTQRHIVRCTEDVGWIRGLPGVAVEDLDGNCATVTLADDAARHDLLRRALDRGLCEFRDVVPTLSEIYREVAR